MCNRVVFEYDVTKHAALMRYTCRRRHPLLTPVSYFIAYDRSLDSTQVDSFLVPRVNVRAASVVRLHFAAWRDVMLPHSLPPLPFNHQTPHQVVSNWVHTEYSSLVRTFRVLQFVAHFS
jgi:hypothetical protein